MDKCPGLLAPGYSASVKPKRCWFLLNRMTRNMRPCVVTVVMSHAGITAAIRRQRQGSAAGLKLAQATQQV